ncbi:MAG: YbaN family protein [Bacteroidota bacterium]|nr:YbaN family protein [Bacteroidota bacterium]
MKKIIFIVIGTISVTLGIIGIFVPLLPTTPLLLLGAACFAKSSVKFHNWLFHNRWFGRYLTNYREGKGIPVRIKVLSIVVLWIVVGCGMIFSEISEILKILLIMVGIAVTIHLMLLK